MEAINSAKTFLIDSIGVGVAGSKGQWCSSLIDCLGSWGLADDSRLLVSGTRHPSSVAALVNGFMIHNSEFDCVHEGAVVHPMGSILGVSLALADRIGNVTGKQLIEAVVLGVDVACGIGVASKTSMKFFRPGTAGGFGATAAAGKLLGFDKNVLINAFGSLYAQTCGTMQSHEESSMLLALQVGFNARNAMYACDLASKGLAGPTKILEGRFGYYSLFEGEYEIEPIVSSLGDVWRINELSHKPYPTGRALQGVIEGILNLKEENGIASEQVREIVATVTPLTSRLVGRPAELGMQPNYARLCLQYCAARMMMKGTINADDFLPSALSDKETFDLASRVTIVVSEEGNPGSMSPATVELRLNDAREFTQTIEYMYGSPAKPLGKEAQLEKFLQNWKHGCGETELGSAYSLLDEIEELEKSNNVQSLVDLSVSPTN